MLAIAIAGCETTAVNPSGVFASDAGCMEGPLAQFGQYIGKWQIEDSSLARDGSGWSDGPGARWDFVCLGDGTAVQDFWMPVGGPVGTNLRTYNPETESWDVIWAIKGQPGYSRITARRHDNGDIVMEYIEPLPDPPRKIAFFPANESGWNWKMEFSFDGGENWTEGYRIQASRIE